MSENCEMKSEPIIDYKKEYVRFFEENKRLLCENHELKDTIVGMCKEFFGKRD